MIDLNVEAVLDTKLVSAFLNDKVLDHLANHAMRLLGRLEPHPSEPGMPLAPILVLAVFVVEQRQVRLNDLPEDLKELHGEPSDLLPDVEAVGVGILRLPLEHVADPHHNSVWAGIAADRSARRTLIELPRIVLSHLVVRGKIAIRAPLRWLPRCELFRNHGRLAARR